MLLRRFAAWSSILILGLGVAVSAAVDQTDWRVTAGRTSIYVDLPALDELGGLQKARGMRQEGTLVS
ncbi:MAG: hypothetical protein IID40_08870, partial [Planctomycetes bacterium]|nr:hypothetical protein [Planctomycetota bacterium]